MDLRGDGGADRADGIGEVDRGNGLVEGAVRLIEELETNGGTIGRKPLAQVQKRALRSAGGLIPQLGIADRGGVNPRGERTREAVGIEVLG